MLLGAVQERGKHTHRTTVLLRACRTGMHDLGAAPVLRSCVERAVGIMTAIIVCAAMRLRRKAGPQSQG